VETFTPYTATKINPIYVFLEKELRGLSPNIHIHVSVSDLYIPRIGPHIFLQQNSQTGPGNILIAHRHINVEIGTENAQFLFWEYLIPIFSFVSLFKLKFIFEELLCICPLSNYGVFIFDANQAQINSVDDDRIRRKGHHGLNEPTDR
jgi:hypothetical protein